uniref:Uncharacterized protein n=1 Tax=Yoonia rhodophyticola TaxID=3137370 RepID=A0AAN0M6J3_9RHOB
MTAIGEGDSRRARITADPVVAGGVIYTLDARATVFCNLDRRSVALATQCRAGKR